jgi:colanic acid/amylovoran biosynthesis glycosyltransferase
MNSNRPFSVLLVVTRYPVRSQPFIVNELTGLIDAGIDVRLLSIRGLNRRLLGKWSKAAATMPYLVSGNLSDRRRFIPFTFAYALYKCVRHASFRYVFDAERPLLRRIRYKRLLIAAAFAGIAPPDILHYENSGLARTAFALGLPQNDRSQVFVSFRGKDLSIAGADELRKRSKALVTANVIALPVCKSFARKIHDSLGFPQSSIHVHYSGVDTAFFSVADNVREIRRASRTRIVYTAGRLIQKKGVAESVRAFKVAYDQLPPDRKNLQMIVAGSGPEEQSIRTLISDMGLQDNVVMVGAYTPDEHREILHRSHVFVSHNLTADDGDQEGIPNVIKEAMAAELPVVATFHSGTPELVTHEESGLLVEEGDIVRMGDYIAQLVLYPEMSERFGRVGWETVKMRFDKSVTTKQLVSLYSEVMRARFE